MINKDAFLVKVGSIEQVNKEILTDEEMELVAGGYRTGTYGDYHHYEYIPYQDYNDVFTDWV